MPSVKADTLESSWRCAAVTTAQALGQHYVPRGALLPECVDLSVLLFHCFFLFLFFPHGSILMFFCFACKPSPALLFLGLS